VSLMTYWKELPRRVHDSGPAIVKSNERIGKYTEVLFLNIHHSQIILED